MIRWTMLVPVLAVPTLPLRLERTPLELGLLPTFGSTQLSCKAKVTFLGAFSILLSERSACFLVWVISVFSDCTSSFQHFILILFFFQLGL
jgi:hypothetical protein